MYAALMAQRAGVTGSGFEVVGKLLKKFLLDVEDAGARLGNPPERHFFSAEADWHEAMLSHFQAVDRAVEDLERHYADHVIGSG